MDLPARIEKYATIEAHRSRPLIAYATSTRPGVPAQMAGDVVREFVDQIDAIDTSEKAVDILIHSTGGDALAAWKLMSMLRERFDQVAVLVPSTAFSAATLFALGADEIVMHPHASLGPIDPQIIVQTPDGQRRQFSFEQIGAFLRFLAEEVGVTEQKYSSDLMSKLLETVDPLFVGGAKRASELATEVGERLLKMHMQAPEESTRAREIAENLNKSFFDHSDAVSRSRAVELDLKVSDRDETLEALMWAALEGLEQFMELREPFDPLALFLADPAGRASLSPPAPIVLPPNAPQQVQQQVWTTAANQALQNAVQGQGVEVEFSVVNAIVESPRLSAQYRTSGVLTAVGMLSGDVQLSKIETEKGWRTTTPTVGEPEAAQPEPEQDEEAGDGAN